MPGQPDRAPYVVCICVCVYVYVCVEMRVCCVLVQVFFVIATIIFKCLCCFFSMFSFSSCHPTLSMSRLSFCHISPGHNLKCDIWRPLDWRTFWLHCYSGGVVFKNNQQTFNRQWKCVEIWSWSQNWDRKIHF